MQTIPGASPWTQLCYPETSHFSDTFSYPQKGLAGIPALEAMYTMLICFSERDMALRFFFKMMLKLQENHVLVSHKVAGFGL